MRVGAALSAFRGERPKRNTRMLQTPGGFVEISFFSRQRAWVAIYDHEGWPARRLTRWVSRGDASLVRALRRAGFDAEAARRCADEISDDWGEPIADFRETVLPGVFVLALAALGATTVGRWLLRRLADTP